MKINVLTLPSHFVYINWDSSKPSQAMPLISVHILTWAHRRLAVRPRLLRFPLLSGIAPLGRVGAVAVPITPVAVGLRIIGG